MVSQTRALSVAALWALLLASSLLVQASFSSASFLEYKYRLSPGTQKEYEFYDCRAEFSKANRVLYDGLRRVCEDCKNLYRSEPLVLPRCMSNCFHNDMFNYCAGDIYSEEKLKDYEEMRLQINA